MKKEAALPVRLDSDTNKRLEAAAERMGFTKSALIRMLIQSFIKHLEENNGRISMPLRWEREVSESKISMFQAADSRPSEYKTRKKQP